MRWLWWSPRMVITGPDRHLWVARAFAVPGTILGLRDRHPRAGADGQRAWRSRGAADRVAELVFDQPIDEAQVPAVGGVMLDDASAPVFTAVRL